MSTDPLERIKPLLDEAARERDTLKHRKSQVELENHQLRRRIERQQDQYRQLDERHAELEQRLEEAEQTAVQARRTMLDHAART